MNLVEKPLKGFSVVITRAQAQHSEFSDLLKTLGAKTLDLPALVIGPPDDWGPLDDALADIENFHWIVFSSANGVHAVQERLEKMGKSLSRGPSSLKIAAVGRKTAYLLESLGVAVDFVPPDFVAESLIQHFPVSGWGLRMLLPRVQSGGRSVLSEAFGKSGVRVVEVAAYESCCPDRIPEGTLKAINTSAIDAITFTSGKTALHTARLLRLHFGPKWEELIDKVKLISIGPQTSLICEENFHRVDREASPHDLEGLAKACIESLSL
ncbi:uroporphyrinogen-III synthase [Prochlorococcus sp. MIT 1300]|uniref:uroporphyrinogen-III synthase n=1 Tax=Prochlorococcus sp. MIT 1300 TaxID=3096218 RepID=UPI002A74D3F2|nr:uroporphyrinogen-III synthase [Prochlorococcus sp. MIT 1300]